MPCKGDPSAGNGGGKAAPWKTSIPLPLNIPPTARDSHFPTATATTIISPSAPNTIPPPSAASRVSTSASPGGYDVRRIFHHHFILDLTSGFEQHLVPRAKVRFTSLGLSSVV